MQRMSSSVAWRQMTEPKVQLHLPPEMERMLREMGVGAAAPMPRPEPRHEIKPAWRPSYPGEEPPF